MAAGFSFSAQPSLFGGKPAGNTTSTGSGFGTSSLQSNSLFGAKTTTTPQINFGGFGSTTTPPTSQSSLFGAKSTASTTSSFGSAGFTGLQSKTTSTTGFSFGTPAIATSGTSLFGSLAKTTASTGFSLFGAKTTTTTAPTLGLGGKTTFGFGSTPASGFPLTSTSIATSNAAKPVENPKEEKLPEEISTLVTELEKFIKTQKDVKEEITKISSEGITKTKQDIVGLKQGLALIANGLQRDSMAVENLKREVGQELNNAEVAHRIKDAAASLQHDFSASMEYFSRLVYSFETRMNFYRKEIEELETFLSTSTPRTDFTPQDLSNVLKRVNESFVGLASELHQVHESVKVLKDHYMHFRRIAYSDMTDPFAARKKLQDKGTSNLIGPSPFPMVQGATIMSSTFQPENKATTIGLSNPIGFGSAFSKPVASGLTRSLSFGGTGKSTGFGLGSTLSAGGSLFNKTSTGTTAGLNLAVPASNTSSFVLQKPPSGKRGKF
ncbi:nucleoporin p58/p45-like [Hydractinia symbiolongicarpus]|uniref:nucleoporin p58/p45-like n=1 Tax=Hydractinia symbiolongicarpus TaxID=13093 RepID=UPI002549CD1A|nr:nucleoporin p58/p45-like [Hydractinia symbiolongicarpus]